MKITDKIVTSKILPTQTNVVWHNPDTGELKMFGNKGWEIAGGSAGSSNNGDSNTNGYPIVTIENDFNIEAKPNTFHDIKNNADDEINITFADEEFYNTNVTNEFIFNINSPANISFDKEIKWNNNEEPDLTQIGVYTISILNGVGCYTFVKIE